MFTFLFADTEAPVLVCPTSQTFETDLGQPTAIAVWPAPNATDNSKKNVSIICSKDSDSQLKIGKTDVVCEAWDPSGNHAGCTFTVDVIGKKYQIKYLYQHF